MRPILSLVLFAGCGAGKAPEPADAGPPAWDRGLPGTERIAAVRGRATARGIIHCHSVYSHDACDDDNLIDGAPNEECLSHLRSAVCETRQDFVMLTEHDVEMADVPFEDTFLVREGDEAVLEGGVQVASRIRCDEGPGTLLFPGAENEIMPVMMTRHPDGDVQARHDVYNGADAAAADQMRAAGGIVIVSHAEHWTSEGIAALSPDGMEVYNFHANVDPDIRRDDLGLDAYGAFAAIASYALDERPLADLAFLSFFEENGADLALWETALETRPMPGVVGTDVHENSVPGALSDGERGDSYRRLFKWMGNYLLVDAVDPAGIRDALGAGRLYTVFQVLGVPDRFDFHVETPAGTLEMGESGTFEAGATVHLSIPSVMDLSPDLPAPEIRGVVLRVGAGVREVIAEGTDDLDVELTEPGAYRAEIRMTPRHLGPYLGGYEPELIRDMVWIYSGGIRVF